MSTASGFRRLGVESSIVWFDTIRDKIWHPWTQLPEGGAPWDQCNTRLDRLEHRPSRPQRLMFAEFSSWGERVTFGTFVFLSLES
jgi:hypothetical protein